METKSQLSSVKVETRITPEIIRGYVFALFNYAESLVYKLTED